MLVRTELPLLEERDALVEDRAVTRRMHVRRDNEREPEEIVGATRSHALARFLVPPMLDVALDELARCGSKDVRARDFRRRKHECENVLELIAEAERTARLVEAAPTPNT